MQKANKIKNLFTCLFLILTATSSQASTNDLYQVDIIAFMHQESSSATEELDQKPLIISDQKARSLSYAGDPASPYVLRSHSLAGLNREYYILKKKEQFTPLFYYSWLQPLTSRRTVKLPVTDNDNWEIEGSFRIRYTSYYTLDAELYFHPQNNNQQAFVVKQKQRLKDDELYYLDHPRAGLLVKIHKLS